MLEIVSNFVAFLENLNFKRIRISWLDMKIFGLYLSYIAIVKQQ